MQVPEAKTSENLWVLYWHKRWQTQPASLAGAHLSAYLQQTCYWSVRKTIANFASPQYKPSDCFQIAIAQVDKVLRGFNPDRNSTLSAFASLVFSNVIRDSLRHSQEADICSDWALLRKISQKRLVKSLQNAGLPSETIACDLLAWTCFKTLSQFFVTMSHFVETRHLASLPEAIANKRTVSHSPFPVPCD